jgi:uncharacterized protein DUF6932
MMNTLERARQKQEFPPLLPRGFHVREIPALHGEFVEAFPESETRESLLSDMVALVDQLQKEKIVGDIWLDGSFVTEKVNPNDIDFILVVESSLYDEGTAAQRQLMIH